MKPRGRKQGEVEAGTKPSSKPHEKKDVPSGHRLACRRCEEVGLRSASVHGPRAAHSSTLVVEPEPPHLSSLPHNPFAQHTLTQLWKTRGLLVNKQPDESPDGLSLGSDVLSDGTS